MSKSANPKTRSKKKTPVKKPSLWGIRRDELKYTAVYPSRAACIEAIAQRRAMALQYLASLAAYRA